MAFIKSPGGASLQYVQAEGPLVHGRCHDMPEHGTPEPFTLMCRGHVEVFNPPRIWLRANRNNPGIHTARMDHVGVLRLEAVEEALADTDRIESPEPFQIRTHHHCAELGDPRGVGSYTGTEDEVSHANKPMGRSGFGDDHGKALFPGYVRVRAVAVARVEGVDGCEFFTAEFKVEHIEVPGDA